MKQAKFQTKSKYIKFNSTFITWVHKVLRWLLVSFDIRTRPIEVFTPLLQTLDRVLQTRGSNGLILYVKALRTQFHSFLAGTPGRESGVKCTSEGCPTVLRPLIEIEKSSKLVSPDYLPILETILYSTRALSFSYVFSGKTIEQPATKLVPSDIAKYTKDFWRTLGFWPRKKVPKFLRWSTYHFSTKSGPNGHALWYALSDLAALPQNLFNDICILGGERIRENMVNLLCAWPILPRTFLPSKKRKLYHRKLVAFPDKEGKTREVAILDYWSQTVLKPLHLFLFRVLKKIPQDRTFSQGDFKTILNGCEVIHSVDLSAATDRFPIAVIESVLKAYLPSYYVRAWHNIMVGSPFWSKDANRYIRYAVGNPMGAYSSWTSFALAHHYILYWCCRELGKDWKTLPYCLLGDDIAVGDTEVADKYIQVISDLGIEISLTKTHRSPHLYEFAKRLVYRGSEVTHFPLSALKETEKRYYSLVTTLMEAEGKGWIPKGGTPCAVSGYYSQVKSFRSKRAKDLQEKSYLCERVMKVTRGILTAEDSLNEIIRHKNYRIRQLKTEEANGILINLAVEVFADSNPENEDKSKGSPPLGLLAERLVMYFTSFMDGPDSELGFKCIEAFPILPVYGSVEETFLDLKRKARLFDVSVNARECLAMKAMTLPRSDQVFSMRTKHVVSLASSLVAKKLIDRLEFLNTPIGRAMLG